MKPVDNYSKPSCVLVSRTEYYYNNSMIKNLFGILVLLSLLSRVNIHSCVQYTVWIFWPMYAQ